MVTDDHAITDRPSRDLFTGAFPDVPITREVDGYQTFMANDRAKRLLGRQAAHCWRDETEN